MRVAPGNQNVASLPERFTVGTRIGMANFELYNPQTGPFKSLLGSDLHRFHFHVQLVSVQQDEQITLLYLNMQMII